MCSTYWFLFFLFWSCGYFSTLLFTVLGLFIPCIFLSVVIIFWFSFSCLLRTRLVDRNWSNLVLLCKVFLSLWIVIDSFAGYDILDWHLGLSDFIQAIWLSEASVIEKSGVSLMGLPLYVIWLYLSLFCTFSALIIVGCRDFLF